VRLAFLTACLEPGRDGVGDYTRLLAAACAARGHGVGLLALNDAHVDAPTRQRQDGRGLELDALRVPAGSPWAERLAHARAWLAGLQPERVSLQFVAYAFEPRGVVAGLGRRLGALAGEAPIHAMLHETWIGIDRGAPWRHRVLGRLQRAALRGLLRDLDPVVVHTSNRHYAGVLAEAGVHAEVLPLFGNVPLVAPPDAGWLERETAHVAPGPPIDGRVFGVFGTIHPEWDPEPLVAALAAAGRREGRTHAVLAIGRQGPGAASWQRLARRHAGALRVGWLGERGPADLSRFLQSIDCGLATTPWHLLGKSGTVAAMLDHGVPVIATRAGAPGACAAAHDPLLQRFDGDLAACLARMPPRRAPRDGADTVALQFLAALAAGGHGARPLSPRSRPRA
jgi:glycosyltransferase involved in cell wall biosynthesis